MELQWVPHGLFRWGRPSRTNYLELPQLGFISPYSGSNKKQQQGALAAPCPPFPVTAPQCAHLLPQHREPRQGQASRPPHLGPTMDTIIPLHPYPFPPRCQASPDRDILGVPHLITTPETSKRARLAAPHPTKTR